MTSETPAGRPGRRRRLIAALVAAFALLGLGGWWALRAAGDFGGGALTTDTSSAAFASPAARIAFLAKYVRLRSAVEDTAFHIVFHDNGFAPSDWSMLVAVRVPPGAVAAWLATATPRPAPPAFAYAAIVPPDWALRGSPTCYSRPGTDLIVFEQDRVIVMRMTTM